MINNTDIVFRRIKSYPHPNLTRYNEDTRKEEPTGAAFKWDSDGISCYLSSEMVTKGLKPKDIKESPTNAILMIDVATIREISLPDIGRVLDVISDPINNNINPHPRDSAHCLIIIIEDKKDSISNSKKTKLSSLLARESILIDPGYS